MHFTADWSEVLTLRDGTAVDLRLLREDDREGLYEAFHRLSPESRYRRFFTGMVDLSKAQLDYFTRIDQVTHVAIVAIEEDHGVGLGRFVLVEEGVAEPALAVADGHQGRGLGTQLMVRLCQAARERDITCFEVEFLAENEAVLQLLRHVARDGLEVLLDEDVYRGRFPVPDWPLEHPYEHEEWLLRLTEAVAQARASLRHISALKKQREG